MSTFKVISFNHQHLPLEKLALLHLNEEVQSTFLGALKINFGFEELMLLCESDITSKNKFKVKRYLENFELVKLRCKEVEEKDHIRVWQPPVTGEEIMKTFGINPSRPVGIIKDAIKDAILDGVIENSYTAAHAFMLLKGAECGLKPID